MRLTRSFTSLRSTFAAAFVALTALSLPAQTFVGSDNFNDNTLTIQSSTQAPGQWRLSIPNEQTSQTGGAWTETNGRLEYTLSADTSTTGMDRGQLIWVSPSSSINTVGAAGLNASTPYDSTWKANIDVTNTTTRTGSNYALAGFEIYVTGNVTNPNTSFTGLTTTGFYSVMFENFGSGGTRVRTQWGVLDPTTFSATTGTYSNNNISTSALGVTSLELQLAYDGITRVLTTGYSTNGGSSFLTGASLDLDGAQLPLVAPLNGGMGLRLFAASDNNVGDTISAGTLFYDNLNVSAIPEPSTYAAIAGVGALGLAVWRKKRKVTA